MNFVNLQENGLRFRLNTKDFTASVINSPNAEGEILVPLFIEYQNKKYYVKSIEQHAFSGDKIKVINFDKNSMVKVFKNESFYNLSIDILYIPSNLEKIEPGCFFKIQKSFKIISSRNKHFLYIENSFLVERNEAGYDTLIYVECDLEKAVIPSTIKEIRPSSLSNNKKLKSLVFNEDSIIESIKYGVIVESLEEIVISKSLTNISQECFQLALNLDSIQISKDNDKYMYKDPFLLKKNDENNEFDEIVFCRNNLEKVRIPNNIKKIASFAFSNCNKINEIGFTAFSKLETIDNYAFYSIPGPSCIILPKFLNSVGAYAFYRMKNLEKVHFISENVRINSKCFYLCDKLNVISLKFAKKLYFDDSLPEKTKIYVLHDIELSSKQIEQFKKRIVYIQSSKESQSKVSDLDQLREKYEDEIDKLKRDYDNKIKELEENHKKIIKELKKSLTNEEIGNKKIENAELKQYENIIMELKEENNNLKLEIQKKNKNISKLFKKCSILEKNLEKYKNNQQLSLGLSSETVESSNASNDENPRNTNIKIIDNDCINKFKLIKEIGSYNNIKICEDPNGKRYALKMMNFPIPQSSFKQFNDEYKNLQFHPNILKIYGINLGDETHQSSILSEFCETNLNEAIKKQSFSNSELAFIIFQIAEGMRFIHSNKVIHQNLTPTNILISSDKMIKISDIGISKIMGNNHKCSINFQAPEVFKAKKYDDKIDVYSFGVVLYYILSKGNMPNILPIDVVKGKMANIPLEFTSFSSDLIRQCWNIQPKDRPSFEMIVNGITQNIFKVIKLETNDFNGLREMIRNYKKLIISYIAPE